MVDSRIPPLRLTISYLNSGVKIFSWKFFWPSRCDPIVRWLDFKGDPKASFNNILITPSRQTWLTDHCLETKHLPIWLRKNQLAKRESNHLAKELSEKKQVWLSPDIAFRSFPVTGGTSQIPRVQCGPAIADIISTVCYTTRASLWIFIFETSS